MVVAMGKDSDSSKPEQGDKNEAMAMVMGIDSDNSTQTGVHI